MLCAKQCRGGKTCIFTHKIMTMMSKCCKKWNYMNKIKIRIEPSSCATSLQYSYSTSMFYLWALCYVYTCVNFGLWQEYSIRNWTLPHVWKEFCRMFVLLEHDMYKKYRRSLLHNISVKAYSFQAWIQRKTRCFRLERFMFVFCFHS